MAKRRKRVQSPVVPPIPTTTCIEELYEYLVTLPGSWNLSIGDKYYAKGIPALRYIRR